MVTQAEAIIRAFTELGGDRRIAEIEEWVTAKYGSLWKDFGTRMSDMVPLELGGNESSNVPEHLKRLRRVDRGLYTLLN